ncbi:alpha-N-acetylgalactosamine-specific lectin [Biomphalaria pfeifferi]|uniref:Alpha-N-acetylgalactosamine-specific lectin n=1 Tax=Biomphalaria pfeifferi TaxID=112525 RepID=A0AAD8FGE4_BIOPF|nr:alpha-N-acetylgalactosamine-specific lectin [Biomphalaria pfeifferi]
MVIYITNPARFVNQVLDYLLTLRQIPLMEIFISVIPRVRIQILGRHHTLLNGTQSVSAYAGYFTKPLTYTEAQATCQSMHSHLFVVKSVIKYFLFLNITTKEYSDWIGLDDIANEGRFVWADDGQEIDVNMKSYLFVSPQPDGQRNENCVYKTSIHDSVKALTFNDANCSLTLSYVCEVDI